MSNDVLPEEFVVVTTTGDAVIIPPEDAPDPLRDLHALLATKDFEILDLKTNIENLKTDIENLKTKTAEVEVLNKKTVENSDHTKEFFGTHMACIREECKTAAQILNSPRGQREKVAHAKIGFSRILDVTNRT